jgi:tripartite-type tricarboxylate transporter receptor subunit TctC
MKRMRFGIALGLLASLLPALATAQDDATAFPTRAIRIVVPFPAGGPAVE